jgi:hypothetical protein
MIIGNNSHVPQFYWINLGKLGNLYFYVFNFQGPKRSPNYVKLCGCQFFHRTRFGEKEVQQGSHEGQTSMVHAARFLGRMGPTRSSLVVLMPSIFVSMDSSWPKTNYIKGTPAGREKERRRNVETRNRSLGDRRSEGKTPAGRCRCDLHPLQRLYLRHHDKEGVVHL